MRNLLGCAFVVGALAMGSMGCAAEAGDESRATASLSDTLTSSYGDVTVDGKVHADGRITAEARNANGEGLVRLTVRGDRVQIEPIGDRSLAARTITVPGDANAKNTLESWNFYAYAYSQHIASGDAVASDHTGTRPLQRISGVGCIAAGGTAMECWFYIAFLM